MIETLLERRLSRRSFARAAASFGAAVAAGGFSRSRSAASSDIPQLIDQAFSKEEDEYLGRVVTDSTTINDKLGNTSAICSLVQYPPTIEVIDYDQKSNKYIPRSNTDHPPLQVARTVAGFVDAEKSGNEKIAVGGFNLAKPGERTAAIASSVDSGSSFHPVKITDLNEELVKGEVSQLKQIPGTDLALFSIINNNDNLLYGLYDFRIDSARLITAEDENIRYPILDNVTTSKDLSEAYVTGRLNKGVADLKIDLFDAFVFDKNYRLEGFKHLDDVFDLRDEQGNIQKTYLLQNLMDHPAFPTRHIFEIDEAGNNRNIDCAVFDPLVNQKLIDTLGQDKKNFIYGEWTSVRLKNINVFENGVAWVTGAHASDFGLLPFAMNFETGEDLVIPGTELPFVFAGQRKFPSDILDEADFVRFQGKSILPGKPEIVNMIHFTLGASIGAGIQTDWNWKPLRDAQPWSQIRTDEV